MMILILFAVCLPVAIAANTAGADWPQWGGGCARNFVSGETRLPVEFHAASKSAGTGAVETADARNIKWTVRLGSQTYSTPAVAGGHVVIGTNDERLDDPRLTKTRGGLVLCFDEASGERLWQLRVPRLKTRNRLLNFDHLGLGICSSPAMDGNRAYIVSSRGEVLCLDVEGQADGNAEPYTAEGVYMARVAELPDKPGRFDPGEAPPDPAPVRLEPGDGDIVWIYDFVKELDVWPQDAADGSVLVWGDYLIVNVSNGVDVNHKNVPSPTAPDLVVLDKRTGRLVAVNDAPVGKRILHGEWSSPCLAEAQGRPLIVWGGGDGVCYAFDGRFAAGSNGIPDRLKRVWQFDCNPAENRYRAGEPLPYNKNHEGPSEIIATPVFCEGRIYVTVGQDSRHGTGSGCVSCISAAGRGDITASGKVWQSREVERSFSSASVAAGLAFVADYAGRVRCFDAVTGALCWTHDLDAHVFGSPLAADGKMYIGDDAGKVTVFGCGREKRVLAVNRLDAPIYTTPVAANGVLYIATLRSLYACEERDDRPAPAAPAP